MDTALSIALGITAAALVAWVWLLLFRGFYWRMGPVLSPALSTEDPPGVDLPEWPPVRVIVPARNEAEVLPRTLPSLLDQDYPGPFEVVLVNDRSADSTEEEALRCGSRGPAGRLRVVPGEPLPPGWTGKLWAMEQGVRAAAGTPEPNGPQLLLFTDADIAHPLHSVRTLVAKACSEDLDLVSLMCHLETRTLWDRLLLPAFVYFFAKLFPFRWVNDHRNSLAAAAGGCLLLRREALERGGGLREIGGELIDDCALASLIKKSGRPQGGRIWLGLSREVASLRDYGGLGGIWNTVARTAFTQLRYSPVLLLLTVLGMSLLYLTPLLGAAAGLAVGLLDRESTLALWLLAAGTLGWILTTASFTPALTRYGVTPSMGFLLPVAGALYTLMTIDSAIRFWRGRGGSWKGRTYSRPAARTGLRGG